MMLTPYTEKDYLGRFNLKTAEKKLLLRGLHQTKDTGKLSNLFQLSELELLVAIIRHRLEIK